MAEFILIDASFEADVLKSTVPVLVDFWAPWCGPCKLQGPIIEELAREFEGKAIKIGKLNVDENNMVAQQYGIMSIPTLGFFVNGQMVEQLVGLQQKSSLVQKINSLIK